MQCSWSYSFSHFINDICEAVAGLNIPIEMFADEVKIYIVLDSGISRDLITACSCIAFGIL